MQVWSSRPIDEAVETKIAEDIEGEIMEVTEGEITEVIESEITEVIGDKIKAFDMEVIQDLAACQTEGEIVSKLCEHLVERVSHVGVSCVP